MPSEPPLPSPPPPDPDPKDPYPVDPEPDEPGPDVIDPGLDPLPADARGVRSYYGVLTPHQLFFKGLSAMGMAGKMHPWW